jgi:hypothetical protein
MSTPVTPMRECRITLDVKSTSPDIMVTPRAAKNPRSWTPPPLFPPSRRQRAPLLQALEARSVADVQAILEKYPEAADEPFWDHGFEHPLSSAARLRCGSEIVNILIQYGADQDMMTTALDELGNNDDGFADKAPLWEFPCVPPSNPFMQRPPFVEQSLFCHVQEALPNFVHLID